MIGDGMRALWLAISFFFLGADAAIPSVAHAPPTTAPAANALPADAVPALAVDEKTTNAERGRVRQEVLNWILGGVAVLQLIVGGLALGGLVHARRAADAAEANINVMRSTAKAQLRPYVFLTEAKILELESDGPVRFSVTMKNGGATPAYDFTNQMAIRARETETEDFSLPVIPLSRSTLGPGASDTIQNVLPRELWMTYADDILDGTLTLFVFGVARYKDSFGDNHVTNYRLTLLAEAGVHDGPLDLCAAGNEAT